MRLTLEQKEACQSLGDALAGEQSSKSSDNIWPSMDHDAYAGSDEGELDDLGETEYESLEENEQESVEVGPNFIENPVQRCILNLLISLFTHLPQGADDKFYSPIFRFLILFSLNKNGQWLPGRRITQLFSALLFCGREVMMALMHNEVAQSSTLRYSE